MSYDNVILKENLQSVISKFVNLRLQIFFSQIFLLKENIGILQSLTHNNVHILNSLLNEQMNFYLWYYIIKIQNYMYFFKKNYIAQYGSVRQ